MGSQTCAVSETAEPPRLCPLCPRLVEFRDHNRKTAPAAFNGAVPSFAPSLGEDSARLLIVGLAPGLNGANRTGRPFTGDFAGELLYATLLEFGFAKGRYAASPDDGLQLVDCMITNAVRCVPPQNKPTPSEIATCNTFLQARIAQLPNLEAIVALGRIAHDSTLTALGCRRSHFKFAHGAEHAVPGDLALYDSFHCSRYNTNTGRLTPEMFRSVFAAVRERVPARAPSKARPGERRSR
jgi:uracil-DNA glycosylase family 4